MRNADAVLSLVPYGGTGGRAYLRMVHEVLGGVHQIEAIPDFKRGYRVRRGRKIRHLAQIAPRIRANRRHPGVFLWDDISVILFDHQMLARTIFVLHHIEPRQFDSQPIEPWLWRRLLDQLRLCRAVVCVSPFWQRFLALHDIKARLIYNAFNVGELERVRQLEPVLLRRDLRLPDDKILVYLGKSVHWKGIERLATLLRDERDMHLISSGNQTIVADTDHRKLDRDGYLHLLRACDVGVFAPELREGWSRCAAEALLTGMPCILKASAGLGDLARLTAQPTLRTRHLAHDVRTLARRPRSMHAVEVLSEFDEAYFSTAWQRLLLEAMRPVGPRSRPEGGGEPDRDDGSWPPRLDAPLR
jgi:glycosyltransferase involved in cell wall biosynthesis